MAAACSSAIESGQFDTLVDAEVDAAVRQRVKDLARRTSGAGSIGSTHSRATRSEDAWAPPYLEYQFAASAPADAAEANRARRSSPSSITTVSLDWYAFDDRPRARLEDSPDASVPGAATSNVRKPVAFVPTQIEFNGMPNVRWWEFEDRQTDFGQHQCEHDGYSTSAARRVRTGLRQRLVRHSVQPPGGLARGDQGPHRDRRLRRADIHPCGGRGSAHGLAAVVDVHDERARDRADARARRATGCCSHLRSRKSQEGDPLEKIMFARDEMTNMVWGVEERIPSGARIGRSMVSSARPRCPRYFLQRVPPSGVVARTERRDDSLCARNDCSGELDPVHRHA